MLAPLSVSVPLPSLTTEPEPRLNAATEEFDATSKVTFLLTDVSVSENSSPAVPELNNRLLLLEIDEVETIPLLLLSPTVIVVNELDNLSRPSKVKSEADSTPMERPEV